MKSWQKFMLASLVVGAVAFGVLRPPRNALEQAFAEMVAPKVRPGVATLVVFGDPKT